MRYYATRSGELVAQAMRDGLLGCIVAPGGGSLPDPGVDWIADNAAFGKGFPGAERWFGWLMQRPRKASCVFAVAPDVVGDAARTLDTSLPWLPMIRDLGIPAAFVAQDGLELLAVPWDDFDVLFVGGSTDWKLGAHARRLVSDARRHGKAVHMGRVNSERRFAYAAAIGCDSADGTYLAFGPDINLPKVLAMARLDGQLPLWEGTE